MAPKALKESRGSKVSEATPVKMDDAVNEVKRARMVLTVLKVELVLEGRLALLDFLAVTELEHMFGVEHPSWETLVISHLSTSQLRTTHVLARTKMGLGASHPLTQAAGATVSSLCLSQGATRLTAPCVTSQALTEAENITNALKKGRTGPGATRTKSRRDGATAPWR